MSGGARVGKGSAFGQDGLFDKVYDQIHGENETAPAGPTLAPVKQRPVKCTVRLFHPLSASSAAVAEMPAYRREWRFRGLPTETYIEMLKKTQRREGTTIVVLESDVVVEHHTLGKGGWELVEERSR